MSLMTLVHVPFSRSTRILWLLEEIGCPYRLKSASRARTLHAALHPPCSPTLHDGEMTMHETGAMARSEVGAMDRLSAALMLLENSLTDSEWLLSEFSGADCQVGWSLRLAARVCPLNDHPALKAYLERCRERPAFQAAIRPVAV